MVIESDNVATKTVVITYLCIVLVDKGIELYPFNDNSPRHDEIKRTSRMTYKRKTKKFDQDCRLVFVNKIVVSILG